MAFPADISLPADAKYINFVENNLAYNPNYDIVWSFQFALSGTEHGFTTFLTNSTTLSSVYPGQYLGYIPFVGFVYLTAEDDEIIVTEDDDPIYVSGGGEASLIAIAFDSTGLYALSSDVRGGVGMNDIKPNSLVIRDGENNLIFNQELSALDTNFVLASAGKYFQTLRFRYSLAGSKLCIDYNVPNEKFINLLTLPITSDFSSISSAYVGFSYSSPVSGMDKSPSVLYLKNFHTQGNTNETATEIVNCVPLASTTLTAYNVLSAIPS